MNLVLTISTGELYERISALTHPSITAYTKKIGAEFLVIKDSKIAKTTPHWEKFQIYDLLKKYERILFLDSDIIIRDDCPNLFEVVPPNQLGAFNEAPWTDRSRELMVDVCKAYDVKLEGWDRKYFNTGVLVISRLQRDLFKKPEKEYFSFYEQSYLNMRIAQEVNEKRLKVFELEYRYNRMSCLDKVTGEHRLNSYIVHYAGFLMLPPFPNPEILLDLIPQDLEKWKSKSYSTKKNIYVSVSGGLGDQIMSEPAVRFLRRRVYPNDNVVIGSHWPRIFKHMEKDCRVVEQGKFLTEPDTPYYEALSFPSPDTITWAVVSNLMCHTVDYCSIALMKRILPTADKTVHLEVDEKDFEDLPEKIEELIVIHAGKHWESKTLPTEYWQAVIDGLAKNHRVCLIGKDDANLPEGARWRGTLDVKCPDNGVDLRNLTTTGQLIALISKAKMVVSNDSAPIHIAGAFDNWIALFCSCKHPDHVLPFRHNSQEYKAIALYKKLPSDEFESAPTCVHGSSAEFLLSDWSKYLLPVEDAIKRIEEVLKND